MTGSLRQWPPRLVACLLAVALAGTASAREQRISDRALEQIRALMAEKASRTPAQRKISSRLHFVSRRQRGVPLTPAVALQTNVPVGAAGTVEVDIRAQVDESLLEQIQASPSGLSLNAPAHWYHKALLEELLSGRHSGLGDAILTAQESYAETGAFEHLPLV